MINKLIEEQLYFDVEFFIIDEFHLIQDEQRGYLLETLIAKLKTIEKIFNQPNKYQIIGMSATLSGLDTLKRWLDKTEVFQSNHRPVPLSEYIYDSKMGILSMEPPRPNKLKQEITDIKQDCEKRRQSKS